MSENTMSEANIPVGSITVPEKNESSEEANAGESAAQTKLNDADQGKGSDSSDGSSPDDVNVPFHEHPRFKEVIEENRSSKQIITDLQTKVDSFEKLMEAGITTDKDGKVELDPAYVEMIGDDEKAVAFNEWMQKTIQEGVSKTLKAKDDEAKKIEDDAKQQQQEWETILDGQIEEIKKTDADVNRDELIRFAAENGSNGFLMDLRVAHKLMTQLSGSDTKVSKKQEKKQNAAIASSGSDGAGAAGLDQPVTLDEVRGKSWDSWRK